MLSQLQDTVDVLDVTSCSEQLRLSDLRNFRPIEQSDLKILEELDALDHTALTDMRDMLNNNSNSDFVPNANVSTPELDWDEVDMKPDLSALRRGPSSRPGVGPLYWLPSNAGTQRVASAYQFDSSLEPTLLELQLMNVNEPVFTLPACPEVDEDLLASLHHQHNTSSGVTLPQDGRYCVPFDTVYSSPRTTNSLGGLDGRNEPTEESTIDNGIVESDSMSEMSTATRDRTWSFNTNASSGSNATSGVFEPRSWASQSSSGTCRRTTRSRRRQFSAESTSSSMLSSSSDTSNRRRRGPTRRVTKASVNAKRASKAFWHQRDVRARSNLLPVPKLADRLYETDYDQPNPRRLVQLGGEIAKLSRVLQTVPQPSSVADDCDKLNTKREKNKFASRVCRLKKKARYEANKIKLFGLKQELEQVRTVLGEAKQLIGEANKHGRHLATASDRLRELARTRLGLVVAGSQTEYVNLVLDLVQRRTTESGAALCDRLKSTMSADNIELRSLALKHNLETYAGAFA